MEQFIKRARLVVRIAEVALTRPMAKAKGPLRTHLIRQIWWGDRVIALARDGEDYSEALEELEFNALAARNALQELDRR